MGQKEIENFPGEFFVARVLLYKEGYCSSVKNFWEPFEGESSQKNSRD